MKNNRQLLDDFISASCKTNEVVVTSADGLRVSPHVYMAIQSARKLLPMLDDYAIKNRVVGILHDIYKDLKADIKIRGAIVNGKKHPALDPSLQAYRIIIS